MYPDHYYKSQSTVYMEPSFLNFVFSKGNHVAVPDLWCSGGLVKQLPRDFPEIRYFRGGWLLFASALCFRTT